MTRPMINEIDLNNNINIIREMNDAEYEQYLVDKTKWEAEQGTIAAEKIEADAAAEAKKAAKAQALAALGLSQEIINLLAE